MNLTKIVSLRIKRATDGLYLVPSRYGGERWNKVGQVFGVKAVYHAIDHYTCWSPWAKQTYWKDHHLVGEREDGKEIILHRAGTRLLCDMLDKKHKLLESNKCDVCNQYRRGRGLKGDPCGCLGGMPTFHLFCRYCGIKPKLDDMPKCDAGTVGGRKAI
jgi:hypothetical protein